MEKLNAYCERMREFVDIQALNIFKAFLKEKSLEEKFNSNVNIHVAMDISHPYLLLANGFDWSSSPEGFDFWCGLELELEEYFKLNTRS